MSETIVLAHMSATQLAQRSTHHPRVKGSTPATIVGTKNGKLNGKKDLYDLPNKFQICAEVEYSIGIIESTMFSNASWEYFKTWIMRQHL
jgi:hypothetical protein